MIAFGPKMFFLSKISFFDTLGTNKSELEPIRLDLNGLAQRASIL